MAADADFEAAWEYLPYDAKKALAEELPKIPADGVGAQLRQRIRNAVVAISVLLRHGSDAFKYKYGQYDLFTGSSASRRPPSKYAMHIAKRLMGSSALDLRTAMQRLEKVVYAYHAAGHKRLPSDRLLDETIAWAFAVRVRKPRPFSGAWFLGKREQVGQYVPWTEVEPVLSAHSLWPERCDLPWYAWCWRLLAEAGVLNYTTADEREIVRMKAIAVVGIYGGYCLLALDELKHIRPQELYVALDGNPLLWDRQVFLTARDEVARTILGHYKRLDAADQQRGRLQFDGAGLEALHEDLEASLPLLGDSLERHYAQPSNWKYPEGITTHRSHNQMLWEKRRARIQRWMMDGFRASMRKKAAT